MGAAPSNRASLGLIPGMPQHVLLLLCAMCLRGVLRTDYSVYHMYI
jgi:hypothetical protein